MPFRGRTNQPAYVRHVAEFIASLKGIELDLLAQKTTSNYQSLFN
jgi:TatD DNase family protein